MAVFSVLAAARTRQRRVSGFWSRQRWFCQDSGILGVRARHNYVQAGGAITVVGAGRLRPGAGCWLGLGLLGAGPGREQECHQQNPYGGDPGGDQI